MIDTTQDPLQTCTCFCKKHTHLTQGLVHMSLSGCAAVLRVSNRSGPELLMRAGSDPRPMKPRQSGRTVSIRRAKQYISFHMPALNTSPKREKRRAVAVTLLSAKLTTDRPSAGQSSRAHAEASMSHQICECSAHTLRAARAHRAHTLCGRRWLG